MIFINHHSSITKNLPLKMLDIERKSPCLYKNHQKVNLIDSEANKGFYERFLFLFKLNQKVLIIETIITNIL